jgi:hypothetical protein
LIFEASQLSIRHYQHGVLDMAANFKIWTNRNRDYIHLRLYGDFDGTSAHELINHIKKYGQDASKIHIHTQSLNNVYPFGLNVFSQSRKTMSTRSRRIAFSGDKAHFFR